MPAAVSPPLVSCVMPTCNRRRFVPQAIRYFCRQDYPARELVVLDDGSDPVADLIPADDHRVRYVRLTGRHTIGAKRTIGCREARGDLVVHWDDDDWMADQRLSRQVAAHLELAVDVSGLRTVLYLDISAGGECWQYVHPDAGRPWVFEPTFCFGRDVALANPFPDRDIGSGTHWLASHPGIRVGPLTDPSFYVGIIHPGNAAPKDTSSACWRRRSRQDIAALLGDDWSFYV
ncbi:glycosyltransferase family 2 protein [Streptomyces sp. NPDC005078]|uniref:glycosyltransferase family 2 protein n=1 Tax=unclassified Streptomyces TaxID=2593676 RepID=UPI0033BC1092